MTGQDAIRAHTPRTHQVGAPTGLYLPPRTRFYINVLRTALTYSKPFWLGASAVTAAMIMFGTVNFGPKPRPHLQQQASLAPVANVAQTVVRRAPDQRQSFKDRWEQARVFFSEAESEELQAEDQSLPAPQPAPAPAQKTVRAKNPPWP